MGFDLLANPFAALGLPADATAGEVTARARQLGNAEAAAASRSLLIPKTRLLAELSYLPGASHGVADATLEALKAGREPALRVLEPLARCNVLAHLASQGKATPSHLGEWAGLQDAIRPTAAGLVDAARRQAGMPTVPGEMLDPALDALVSQHADAFTEGMLAAPDGADLLAALLVGAPPEASARASFLRRSAAAWERATASDAARDLESAAPIEAVLRYRSDPEAADQLATIAARFANRTKPPRIAARLVGLTHSASVDAAQRWRAVALDLNNRQDAVSEAVCIFEALADGFGTEDELGACTARDLKICRERLASGEGTPEMRRLLAAIEAAGADAHAFHRCELLDGKTTASTPPSVAELYDAFVGAVWSGTSDLPWKVLRGFTIRLQSEFLATGAALAFTELAIARGKGSKVAAQIMRELTLDRRVLRRAILSKELEFLLRAGKRREARHVLSELLSLADNAREREDLQATFWKRNRQRTSARVKYGFAAFAAVMLFAYITLSGGNAPPLPRTDTHPSSASRYNQSAVPSNFAPRPPAPADPDAGQPERRPAPGSAVLTRAELRWCQYQRARVQAARDYLDALESNLSLPVDRYNAGVDAFNAFIAPIGAVCGDYKYHESDGSIIDAELKQHAATLKAEGQNLIATAVRAPDPRAVRATSAAPQSTTPAATDRSDTNPVSGGSYNQAAVSSNVAPSPPAPVDPDAGQPEQRPVPGNTVLTRAELSVGPRSS